MTEWTYEDDVSLVVLEEIEAEGSVVVDGGVKVLAELNASYFVVGDVKTWAIGSVSDSEIGLGTLQVLSCQRHKVLIILTHGLVVDLLVNSTDGRGILAGTYPRKWFRQRHHSRQIQPL